MARPEALVIDDDEDMNRMIGAYAELGGFKYRSATTGRGGLEEVRQNVPAVVLLDVMLSDLDGFEVCRRLKSDATTRDVPVILITALTDADSRHRGRTAGADDFIAKPFDPGELMEKMKGLCSGADKGSNPNDEIRMTNQ